MKPLEICPGDPVELEWQTVGDASLTIQPTASGAPADGHVADHGKITIKPVGTTTVTLSATRLFATESTDRKNVSVRKARVLLSDLTDPDSGCGAGAIWSVVRAKGDDLVVGQVANSPKDTRTYEVVHDGRTDTIKPGVTSTAFQGTHVSGDWKLKSPLGPGEQCGPSAPRRLLVEVFTECGSGSKP